MAIDSWGRVMACQVHGEGMILVDIDLQAQNKLRQQFPCLLHQR
jgi:predicted amidohydrolase